MKALKERFDIQAIVTSIKEKGTAKFSTLVDCVDYSISANMELVKTNDGKEIILVDGEGGYYTESGFTRNVKEFKTYRKVTELEESVLEIIDEVLVKTGCPNY